MHLHQIWIIPSFASSAVVKVTRTVCLYNTHPHFLHDSRSCHSLLLQGSNPSLSLVNLVNYIYTVYIYIFLFVVLFLVLLVKASPPFCLFSFLEHEFTHQIDGAKKNQTFPAQVLKPNLHKMWWAKTNILLVVLGTRIDLE
jgi:hypothetical protein